MIASSKMQRLTSSRPGSGALLRAAPRLAAPVHVSVRRIEYRLQAVVQAVASPALAGIRPHSADDCIPQHSC